MFSNRALIDQYKNVRKPSSPFFATCSLWYSWLCIRGHWDQFSVNI